MTRFRYEKDATISTAVGGDAVVFDFGSSGEIALEDRVVDDTGAVLDEKDQAKIDALRALVPNYEGLEEVDEPARKPRATASTATAPAPIQEG